MIAPLALGLYEPRASTEVTRYATVGCLWEAKQRRGQNYHQWLSAQYGLKKLVEHVDANRVARTCETMTELRDRMEWQATYPVASIFAYYLEPTRRNRPSLGSEID